MTNSVYIVVLAIAILWVILFFFMRRPSRDSDLKSVEAEQEHKNPLGS